MKARFPFFLTLVLSGQIRAQIPVTDVANLVANQVAQAETAAKWVESIAQLRTQIDQLNRQLDIQGDIRAWSGNPSEAGSGLSLRLLGAEDLAREYGQVRSSLLALVESLDSLEHTGNGTYRPIGSVDLNGAALLRDRSTFRRYAVMDATAANAEQVKTDTQTRAGDLQTEIALTLEELKAAPTVAATQKLSVKLSALNGQLVEVESTRRREVDAVTLQKAANDSRMEEERLAAAESAAKDDFLANQRISAYMNTVRLRRNPPNED